MDLSAVCQVGQGRYHPHDSGNGGESLSRMVRLGEMTGKPEHRKEGKTLEETFGGFAREKRRACGLTLRGLAAKLELSPVYMSNIENSRRAAPTHEYLDRLAEILQLDKADQERLLDLAAKSQHNRVSADLPNYIMDREIVRAALRTAKEADATDQEWQDFIDRINRRMKNSGEAKGSEA